MAFAPPPWPIFSSSLWMLATRSAMARMFFSKRAEVASTCERSLLSESPCVRSAMGVSRKPARLNDAPYARNRGRTVCRGVLCSNDGIVGKLVDESDAQRVRRVQLFGSEEHLQRT